ELLVPVTPFLLKLVPITSHTRTRKPEYEAQWVPPVSCSGQKQKYGMELLSFPWYKLQAESRVGEKSWSAKDPSAQNLQAIAVKFSTDDDIFRSPGVLQFSDLSGDSFISPGSSGTLSNKQRRNKGKGNANKVAKLLDVQLTTVQYMAKLTTSFTFCKAALTQAVEKSEQFFNAHEELTKTFRDLLDKGISEDRVMDRSLGLREQAGVIKAFFTLDRRTEACRLALHGADLKPVPSAKASESEMDASKSKESEPKDSTGGSDPGHTDGDLAGGKSEEVQNEIQVAQEKFEKLIKSDKSMATYASKAVVVGYFLLDDLFDSCSTKDEFKDRLKLIQDRAKDTKTLAGALRKCVTELGGMIKAVNKAHQTLQNQLQEDNKRMGTLRFSWNLEVNLNCNSNCYHPHQSIPPHNDQFRIGRMNFQKIIQESDPDALKHFKHIMKARPIRVVKDATIPGGDQEDGLGELVADLPMIVTWSVRKGRSVIRQVSDGEGHKVMDSALKQFREQTSTDGNGKVLAALEEKGLAEKVSNALISLLPKEWDNTCMVQETDLETASNDMEDGKGALSQLQQAATVPDGLELETLCAGHVRTGDVLFCPAGYIMLEKAVNDTSVALRIFDRHVSDSANASLRLVGEQVKMKPYLELMLKVLPEIQSPKPVPSLLEQEELSEAPEEAFGDFGDLVIGNLVTVGGGLGVLRASEP
ncbi:unnamed protein product, partial [Symbiodinium necroappetens]